MVLSKDGMVSRAVAPNETGVAFAGDASFVFSYVPSQIGARLSDRAGPRRCRD
jgi:hypothetical protein